MNSGARGFVLTFHSHNVCGNTYETNDHVALDESLALLESLRIPVLRLLDAVRRLRGGTFDTLPQRFACLTFDDGSDYDWRDLEFPGHGPQRSMRSILRAHSRKILGLVWTKRAHATSFVIASDQARREIAASALGDAGLMTDGWWRMAQASGLVDIGAHGWNHVHPAVSEMSARPELVEHFERIDACDAPLQVSRSFETIRARAGGDSARIFAYPYGQVADFLADEYFPRQREIVAAMTAAPRPLMADSDPWRLPRYVCGPDWKSNPELKALLAS
jgi:peptidoglycan/xylan/chitin deacetylase (PgdA/CDA1 family)